MSHLPVIPNALARRLFLDRHALAEPPVGAASGAALAALIDRIGFVQVDSINTVSRAHHMILWARRQSYKPEALARFVRVRADALPAGYRHRRIALQGLRGGHSGVNIHEERGNAIKLLVRVLHALAPSCGLRLVTLQGGTARNALPREAFATVALPSDQLATLDAQLAVWHTLLRQEWGDVEPSLCLQARDIQADDAVPDGVLPQSEQDIWLDTLLAAPHGVKRQSQSVAGVVESSNNLGMVDLSPLGGHCNFMVRSLRDSLAQALALASGLVLLALALGAALLGFLAVGLLISATEIPRVILPALLTVILAMGLWTNRRTVCL